MPARGYRKGISDAKVPTPCSVRTHISDDEFARLVEQARRRDVTISKLLRTVLQAHLSGSRVHLPPPPRVAKEALNQLTRAGNNLNQVARQAHLMHLHLIRDQAIAVLQTVEQAVKRLSS